MRFGRIWVGLNDGVSVLEDGRFTRVATGDALPHPQGYNLLAEGVAPSTIHITGNTVIDALHWVGQRIAADPSLAARYTVKGNLVAVISNGTAILGLGNLGALASKPVMEGKAVLFKRFADVDSIDIELATEDPEAFINAVALMEPTFGGINLEDIKAPECFIIEQTLKERLKIPIMHDDQHGTALHRRNIVDGRSPMPMPRASWLWWAALGSLALRWVLAAMGGLWGLRLGTYLWRRNWRRPRCRYSSMRWPTCPR